MLDVLIADFEYGGLNVRGMRLLGFNWGINNERTEYGGRCFLVTAE